jgi:hypothetical protein
MRKQTNKNKGLLQGSIANTLGFIIEFLTFNIMNTFAFNYFWMKHTPIMMLIYFILLFVIITIEIDVGKMFIKKYLERVPIMAVVLQRRKFGFFALLYFIAFIGANGSMRNSLFFNYVSTCLLPYLIGWIIYIRKYKKLSKLLENSPKEISN